MTLIAKQLYQSAASTSIGRALLYRALWLRYRDWRFRNKSTKVTNADLLVSALTGADFETACKLAVNSWCPIDVTNERLRRQLLLEATFRRSDLGVTPEGIDCIVRVISSKSTISCVDNLVAENYAFGAINTALQIAFLSHVPKSGRRPMLGTLHPRKMLAVIASTRRYVKGKRKIIPI